jgi:hypothetical protein
MTNEQAQRLIELFEKDVKNKERYQIGLLFLLALFVTLFAGWMLGIIG